MVGTNSSMKHAGGLAFSCDDMLPVGHGLPETDSSGCSSEAAQPPAHLPAGCAIGTPVVRSSVAAELPEGMPRFFLAMQFVYQDDYHSVMELARAGCADDVLHHGNLCGFSLCLRPEDDPDNRQFPRVLQIQSANLLHYAISIGSCRAAAALLIIRPDLLLGRCMVSAVNDEAVVWNEAWTALDLAVLFCDLYTDGRTEDVIETEKKFKNMLRVLNVCASSPDKLPYVCLPAVEGRVAAAGIDPEAACSALLVAAAHAEISWTPGYPTLNGGFHSCEQ
jgi:hypothetical protein